MDRSQRSAIIEPILLILKQRTGIATVAAMIVTAIGLYLNLSVEEIGLLTVPIFVYIGKQGYVDSKEKSSETIQEVVELKAKIEHLLQLIEIVEDTKEEPVKETFEDAQSNKETEI